MPSPVTDRLSGLEQDSNNPPSSEHSKELPASVEVNSNVAEPELDSADGATVIVVSGAVASMFQLNSAGVVSVLPAESVALTAKV